MGRRFNFANSKQKPPAAIKGLQDIVAGWGRRRSVPEFLAWVRIPALSVRRAAPVFIMDVLMAKTQHLVSRAKVARGDQWDLSSLYGSDAAWEKDFQVYSKRIAGYGRYKGKLGTSAKTLAACLEMDAELDRLGERLGNYAFLRTTEDQANSTYQRMKGRYENASSKAGQAAAFIRPEILAIAPAKMKTFLRARELAPWKLALERILRYRPHTLSDGEEKLLAMQAEMAGAASQVFRQLNDADLKWPALKNEKGQRIELSHASYITFLHSPKRAVRQEVFHTYYTQFEAHKNALAAAYNASVQRDVYYAKARHYPSAREGALFHDNVPVTVYDNLVGAVHKNLPALHHYYALRQRVMKLKELYHYDTYTPILTGIEKHHTWEQAVEVIVEALAPLGDTYRTALQRGLTVERWADRYPNRGKNSGAFSSGGFDGFPYMLMNYQPAVLDQVFTLAHEAGHSMHTYLSARHQPYQYYNYTIFVAEVASTFNEQLLLDHMLGQAQTKKERAFLINHALDEIRGTIFRQTMFAEFETITHGLVEGGEPLTVALLRKEYRKLLDRYFGPDFAIDEVLELECLRIPHFYNAFYVYKYATGLSAAIALSQRVLKGGERELGDYLSFLKGGCSKFPLDLLRGAGVDMEKPGPVNTALAHFGRLVEELDTLL